MHGLILTNRDPQPYRCLIEQDPLVLFEGFDIGTR